MGNTKSYQLSDLANIRDTAREHGYTADIELDNSYALLGVMISDNDGQILVTTMAQFRDWAGY